MIIDCSPVRRKCISCSSSLSPPPPTRSATSTLTSTSTLNLTSTSKVKRLPKLWPITLTCDSLTVIYTNEFWMGWNMSVTDSWGAGCLPLAFRYDYRQIFASFFLSMEEISASASKEYSLEKAMEKMKSEWSEMKFELVPYRDTVSMFRVDLCMPW